MQTNTEERSLVLGLKNQRLQFVFEKLRHICDNMACSDYISVLFILIGEKTQKRRNIMSTVNVEAQLKNVLHWNGSNAIITPGHWNQVGNSSTSVGIISNNKITTFKNIADQCIILWCFAFAILTTKWRNQALQINLNIKHDLSIARCWISIARLEFNSVVVPPSHALIWLGMNQLIPNKQPLELEHFLYRPNQAFHYHSFSSRKEIVS